MGLEITRGRYVREIFDEILTFPPPGPLKEGEMFIPRRRGIKGVETTFQSIPQFFFLHH